MIKMSFDDKSVFVMNFGSLIGINDDWVGEYADAVEGGVGCGADPPFNLLKSNRNNLMPANISPLVY